MIGGILTILGFTGIVLYTAYTIRKKKIDSSTPNNYDHNEEAVKSWFSLAKTFNIVLIVGLLIRAFILQPFIVEGISMEDNFHDKEAMLVDKISYRFTDIDRGDVLIFRAPKNPTEDYIKRVIGLPGETVEIKKDEVLINNKRLIENYLSPDVVTYPNNGMMSKITLEENEYFVMGDNREHSSDSREWGVLPRENIIGKAFYIVYPFNNDGVVKNPQPKLIENSNQ